MLPAAVFDVLATVKPCPCRAVTYCGSAVVPVSVSCTYHLVGLSAALEKTFPGGAGTWAGNPAGRLDGPPMAGGAVVVVVAADDVVGAVIGPIPPTASTAKEVVAPVMCAALAAEPPGTPDE